MNKEEVFDRVLNTYETYVDRCLRGETPDKIVERTLADGRIVRVVPVGILRAQLSISAPPPCQNALIDHAWEYKTQVRALIAAFIWEGEGEPEGWWRQAQPDLSMVYNPHYKDTYV